MFRVCSILKSFHHLAHLVCQFLAFFTLILMCVIMIIFLIITSLAIESGKSSKQLVKEQFAEKMLVKEQIAEKGKADLMVGSC